MSDAFQEFAHLLRDHGIEAEAVLDSTGEVAALRFYADGRAFTVQPHHLDDGQIRLAVQGFEVIEGETAEERLGHVLEVLRRAEIDR